MKKRRQSFQQEKTMENKKKTVTITLYKKEIFYDMDANTYKKVDASMTDANPRAQNAVQSDVTEQLDSSLMGRICDNRDAQLRMRLMWCLKDCDIDRVDNIPDDNPAYEYVLEVPEDFKGDKLKVLAAKMHDYIVRGGLLDWYYRCGLSNSMTSVEVQDIESDILSLLRPSSARRPMQPFGPAKKIS